MPDDVVELWGAWQWTCPECGVDQFESSVTMEMTIEERRDLAIDHGLEIGPDGEIPEWYMGQMMSHPEEVICQNCGRIYQAVVE